MALSGSQLTRIGVGGAGRAYSGFTEKFGRLIPLFGFTTFPFEATREAQAATGAFVAANGNMFAIHLDEQVPWQQALDDTAFPADLMEDWNGLVSANTASHPVYLALSVLDIDREDLVLARDDTPIPPSIDGAAFDDPDVKTAWWNYVKRAIDTFSPSFLCAAIEVEGVAGRTANWPNFEALMDHIYANVRASYPDIKVGVSYTMQGVMHPPIASVVTTLVEKSDYFGLSIYPHTSPFGEAFGYAPLPSGLDKWRDSFLWAEGYTDKPIAICETGFTTEDVDLEGLDTMTGTPEEQTRFVKDLVCTAHRMGYMFVMWFIPIDYDILFAWLPDTPDKDATKIWQNTGMQNELQQDKPALAEWLKFRRGLSHCALNKIENDIAISQDIDADFNVRTQLDYNANINQTVELDIP